MQSPRHSTGFSRVEVEAVGSVVESEVNTLLKAAPKKAARGRQKPTIVTRRNRTRTRLAAKIKADRKPKGRPKKWVPSIVTDEDKARGLQILADYGTPDDAEIRIVRDFHLFLTINELQPTGYAMLLWCGQCLVAGLGPGSLETYATFVRKVLPRGDPMIKKLTKALMRQHADFDTKSAPVVSDADLIAIMLLLPDDLRAGVFVMLIAGLRPIALKWLRRKQIAAWSKSRDASILLHVQIRVDKNAWKRVHRSQLAIPRAWTSLTEVPEDLMDRYNLGDPNHRLFWKDHSATELNQALAKVSRDHSLPRATSTSYRHGYMNRLFAIFDGDMEKIKPFTLHHSRFVTKAHYFLWAGERPPPGDLASSSDEEEM